MTTNTQAKCSRNVVIGRALVVGLILAAVALVLLVSTLPSGADSSQTGMPAALMVTATPGGPELMEKEATFTIGDIGQFARPPAVAAQAVGSDGTVIILDEGFEGAWPPAGWAAQPRWGASSCRAFSGAQSAWVEGNAGLACGSNYANDENAFLIYGPFSLADATAASLSFKLWLNSESGYDYLCFMASVDGASFNGTCTSGTTSGQWADRTLDLTGRAGKPTVWIAFVWNTDARVLRPEGAFVDDVRVTKTTAGPTVTPTRTSTATSLPTSTPTPLPTPAWWWHIEQVSNDVAPAEESVSLALGSAGYPYISFSNGLRLQLARWDGSTWRIEMVDDGPITEVVKYTSLALDSADLPHIAYAVDITSGNDILRYASWDGSAWQIEPAVSSGLAVPVSLVLDRNGYPHISYSILGYAYKDASGWHRESVPESGSLGPYTSLVLDGNGYPHFSYQKVDLVSKDELKYAYKDASGWHIQTVDSDYETGLYPSLKLDANGYPHISYYRLRPGCNLRYARWDGGAWHTETIDTASGCSYFPIILSTSLALDVAGRSHISYYRPIAWNQGELKYAHKDEAGWHIELVESGGVGQTNSLALDAAGRPRIAYVGNYRLKFARWLDAPLPTPTPTSTPVTPTPVVPAGQAQAYWPELAPVPDGGVVVAWYDDRFGSSYREDVFARRFGPDGNPVWPADVRVSAGPGTSGERYPGVAVDGNGHSFVVWQGGSQGGQIFAQKLSPNGDHTWSRDDQVYTTWNGFQPTVGTDASGNWYVAWGTHWDDCIELWRGYRGSCSDIYAAKRWAWGESVTDPIYVHAYWPDMAVDSEGNIHLTWQQGSAQGDSDIFGLALTTDKVRRWPNPVRINGDIGSTPQSNPRVAVNTAGDTYFAWVDKRNGNRDIYAQKFDVNVGYRLWTDDMRVNGDTTTADQIDPDLAVDADGYIYVIWADARNGVPDIYAQKLRPDGTRVWPQDLRINATSQADERSKPVIAVDSTGALYIAWESRRGDQHDIFMQSYTADGTRRWAADVAVEGVTLKPAYLPLIVRSR